MPVEHSLDAQALHELPGPHGNIGGLVRKGDELNPVLAALYKRRAHT